MLRWLLDTNLCIRVLRDRLADLRERFNREADALCISTICLYLHPTDWQYMNDPEQYPGAAMLETVKGFGRASGEASNRTGP